MSKICPCPVRQTRAVIPALDGHTLQATIFERVDPLPDGPVTVIGAGVAVPQRYYAKFAKFLAARGRIVVTFDYRGIGGSLHGSVRASTARLRDWGQKDIPGVLDYARKTWPHRPIHWVGHSHGGGFGIGLASNNHLVDRLLGISVPHGYWGEMDGIERYRVAVLLHVAMPLLAHTLGFVPGRGTGLGEDLPKAVALEWKSWICSPNSMWDVMPPEDLKSYHTMGAPLCFMRATDDPWVSERSAERISAAFTGARERSIIRVEPAAIGGLPIGHMGFFRARNADALWPRAAAWLDGAAV